MSIKNNTASLQEVLNTMNALPDAGGVELPELANEGAASDLLSGKQLIDGSGDVVTGTFTIDEELSTQDDLIAQIQVALNNKATYNTIFIGSQEPTSDIGVDGDIYIVRSDNT